MTLAGTRQRDPVLTFRRATDGWYVLLTNLPTDIDPAEILIRYTGTGSRGMPLRCVQGTSPAGAGWLSCGGGVWSSQGVVAWPLVRVHVRWWGEDGSVVNECDCPFATMYEPMVAGTQQHEVVQLGRSTL
jgi:hypothetical protein